MNSFTLNLSDYRERLQSPAALLLLCLLFPVLPFQLGQDSTSTGLLTPIAGLMVLLVISLRFLFPAVNVKGYGPHMVLTLLIALRLMLGYLNEPTGLSATYFSEHGKPGDYLGTERHPYKRVDHQIDFIDAGFSFIKQTFPLYYANNAERFSHNLTAQAKAKRENFAFNAQWQGYLKVQKPTTIRLAFSGGDGALKLGELERQGTPSGTLDITVKQGIYPIEVTYSRNDLQERKLSLQWQVEEEFIPIPTSHLSPSNNFVANNNALHIFNIGLHLVWLGVLLMLFRPWSQRLTKEKTLLGLLALALFLAALGKVARDGEERDAQIMSVGNDWHAYVTQARNVASGDWLDTASTGGDTFFWNVGWRYALAIMHLLVGEQISLIILLQQIVLVVFFLCYYYGIKHLFGQRLAVISLLLAVFSGLLIKFPAVLLDTTLNIFLSSTSLYLFLCYGRSKQRYQLVWASLLLGLSCLVRGNFILFIPLALGWVIVKSNKTNRSKQALIALVLILLPLLFTPVRNQIVAGDAQWMPTSGSINLWIANRPPKPGEDEWSFATHDAPQGERDRYQQVFNTIINHPGLTLKRMTDKSAYLLGIDLKKDRIKWGVLLPSLLAICLLILWRMIRLPREEIAFLASWILANYITLILIFPWGYGWRLSAPVFPVLYLFAAMTLSLFYTMITRRTSKRLHA